MVLELRTDRTEMCIGCDGSARDRARVCLHSERYREVRTKQGGTAEQAPPLMLESKRQGRFFVPRED